MPSYHLGLSMRVRVSSATCSDGSPVTAIDLGPGETVTCTFTNTKRGQIVVEKATVPSTDTTEFAFELRGAEGVAFDKAKDALRRYPLALGTWNLLVRLSLKYLLQSIRKS